MSPRRRPRDFGSLGSGSLGARGPTRLETALLFVSVLVPIAASASRVQSTSDAAHDPAVVRALGLGFTGALRALDVVAQLFLDLPLGTRAMRAALAGAAFAGVTGGLLFTFAKRMLDRFDDAPVVNPWVAAVASACACLGGPFVVEASTAGSSMLGVVLSLVPLVLVAERRPGPRWFALGLAMGLAASYEPLVGVVAVGGVVVYSRIARLAPPSWTRTALAFAAGGLPAGAAWVSGLFARHRLVESSWTDPLGEGTALGARSLRDLLVGELGWVLLGLGAAGLALALTRRRSRAPSAALAFVLLVTGAAVARGAPAGPWRFGAASLVLLAAVALLAGVALQRAVVMVARANVPLAAGSAAMVIMLAVTLPVMSLDDAMARSEARAAGGTRAWEDEAFEPLPEGTLLLVSDRDLYARVLASEATGELRDDLAVVATFDAVGTDAEMDGTGGPDLRPLLRDLLLYGEARERTLSTLAAARPLALAIDPAWDHSLARHVVPHGLLGLFYPEPRGASERLQALAAADAATLALRDVIAVPGDAALATLTTRMLDARARALSGLGEKDAAGRVSEDSLALALPGARGARRARRLVTSRFSWARPTTSP